MQRTTQLCLLFLTVSFLISLVSAQERPCGGKCTTNADCGSSCAYCFTEHCQTLTPISMNSTYSGTLNTGDIWPVFKIPITSLPANQYVEYRVTFSSSANAVIALLSLDPAGPTEVACSTNLTETQECVGFITNSTFVPMNYYISLQVVDSSPNGTTSFPYTFQIFTYYPTSSSLTVGQAQFVTLNNPGVDPLFFSFSLAPSNSHERVKIEFEVQNIADVVNAYIGDSRYPGPVGQGFGGYLYAGSNLYCVSSGSVISIDCTPSRRFVITFNPSKQTSTPDWYLTLSGSDSVEVKVSISYEPLLTEPLEYTPNTNSSVLSGNLYLVSTTMAEVAYSKEYGFYYSIATSYSNFPYVLYSASNPFADSIPYNVSWLSITLTAPFLITGYNIVVRVPGEESEAFVKELTEVKEGSEADDVYNVGVSSTAAVVYLELIGEQSTGQVTQHPFTLNVTAEIPPYIYFPSANASVASTFPSANPYAFFVLNATSLIGQKGALVFEFSVPRLSNNEYYLFASDLNLISPSIHSINPKYTQCEIFSEFNEIGCEIDIYYDGPNHSHNPYWYLTLVGAAGSSYTLDVFFHSA